VKGQSAKMQFRDAASAIAEFEDKKYKKTVKGDYQEIQISYDDDDEEEEKKDDEGDEDDGDAANKKMDKQAVKSILPKGTVDFVRLIFDMKMMNKQMKEIGYDAKKMPLGKLSKQAI